MRKTNPPCPLSQERVVVPQVTEPLKYCLPHAVVSFGPAGQLIRVNPGLVMQGDPGLLEIHSLEVCSRTHAVLERRIVKVFIKASGF